MQPTVTVDAREALAKFSKAGIPEAVRNQLRRTLPDLTKRLGGVVDDNLTRGLKSRNRLTTKKEMIENPTKIVGRVRVLWTGDPAKKMVPFWLERGTKPHPIVAKNARNLYFYWEKIGAFFIGPKVMHPGFKGLEYMQAALLQMEPEIVDVISSAAKQAAR